MNEKLKNIFIIIGAVVVGLLAFVVGRGSNRRGVQSDNDSIERIRSSVAEQQRINSETRQSVGVLAGTTQLIRQNNNGAIGSIRTAREILKSARNRAEGP